MNAPNVTTLLNGIYLFPDLIPDAVATFSGREFDAAQNLTSFLHSIGIEPDQFSTVKQVHGNRVILAEGPGPAEEAQAPEADALVTGKKGLGLVIRTADCLPVFFVDKEAPAVGICHAGWRGAKEGIVLQTVRMLGENFGSVPASLEVALGPAIRKTCYEVGREFLDHFPGFIEQVDGKYFFDLAGMVKNQLREAGIPEGSIHDSGLCTACETDRFFSVRREGQDTGRLISAIVLR